MAILKNQDVLTKLNTYPDTIKEKLLSLRELIFEVAIEKLPFIKMKYWI